MNQQDQRMRDTLPLSHFQSSDPQQPFPDYEPGTLPHFFQTNLIDQCRVVKQFLNDPQANLRIFSYQYLKLCYEFSDTNFNNFYINQIDNLINNPRFIFHFPQDKQKTIYNDRQFKRLLEEFFEYMGANQISVNEGLARYPIMEEIMVVIFRSLLMENDIVTRFDELISRDQIFGYLAQKFEINTTVHDNCTRFVETDTFAYEERPNEVYLIYIDYDRAFQNLDPDQLNNDRDQIIEEQPRYTQNQSDINQNVPEFISPISPSNQTKGESSYEYSQLKEYNQQLTSNKHQESSTYVPYYQTSEPRSANDTDKKRKQISYMGASGIYDFADYTSNSFNEESNSKKQIRPAPPSKIVPVQVDQNQQTAKFLNSSSNNSLQNQSKQTLQGQKTKPALYQAMTLNDATIFASNCHKKNQPSVSFNPIVTSNEQKHKALQTFNGPDESKNNSLRQLQESTVDQGLVNYTQAIESSMRKEKDYLPQNMCEVELVKPKLASPQYNFQTQNTNGSTGINSNPNFIQKPKKTQVLSSLGSVANKKHKSNNSLEFTDSFTLKQVEQPYRSNIQMIKTRGRDQRKSIGVKNIF